ncbi:MAG: heme-binding protein [Alphaproteobacteria bacterium]|nr:heme-binding protein [Alphaproteobacteria bacterium]
MSTPPVAPDLMPYDIPYGPPITADRAAKIAEAAIAEAKKAPRNWKLAIAVVDPNGDLVYFYKMDDTQLGSIEIAIEKARTAARLRRPTEDLWKALQTQAGAYLTTFGFAIAMGAFPLIENGKLIGAIGASGGIGAQDNVAAKAAADLIK